MYYLLMEKFNNYLNRFMKKFDTVQEYKDFCTANSYNFVHYTTKSVNFNKRDNITSSHVFNDNLKPNYLLWINETTGAIVSRWFVTRYTHTSGNQFNAELKKDVLADNYEAVLESPAFIEKGYVGDTDIAIFNREDILVNQIKKGEALIKDVTTMAWIIGYVAPGTALDLTMTDYKADYDVEIGTSFANWSLSQYCNAGPLKNINSEDPRTKVYFNIQYGNSLHIGPYFWINSSSHYALPYDDNSLNNCWILDPPTKVRDFRNTTWWSNISWSSLKTALYTDNPSWVNDSNYNDLASLNGKRVKFTDGIYVFTFSSALHQESKVYADNENSAVYNYLYTQVSATLSGISASITSVYNKPVNYDIVVNQFSVIAVKDESATGTYNSKMLASHYNLQDAPYKMFAIPYPDNDYECKVNNITISKELSLSWAIELIKGLGSNLYDIQLLPFFPGSELETTITIIYDTLTKIYKLEMSYNSSGDPTIDFMYLKDSSNNNKNIAFFFKNSNFKKNLLSTYNKNRPTDFNLGDISSYKESNELDLYRICSPNYSSSFEFSPAKNSSNRRRFIAYCTYKPYNPFIYVAPKYYNLYGEDFGDNRGLILAGDFSLPIITDAWTQYQLNNKNYALIFDRQIESLELNQSWERRQSILQASVGTFKGGTAGGMAGGMVGGIPGAIAGAVIGTVASGSGGIMDLAMQKELQRDAKDYAKDNFRMNLQNIQALPNTLNKVSSIIATSKIYPFLEYYSCTEQERETFRNKIKYNGMTINRIGYIKDFLEAGETTFIKAKLIRNESIACSSDELLEISNELNKGVYI